MDIIYHDVGGTHSVAVASALHLNKLPMDRTPNKDEILSLPTFDKLKTKDLGHLIYQGEDEFGNQVYTLGCKYAEKFVIPAIKDTYNLLGDEEELMLVKTKSTINFTMKVGGYTSRALGLMTIGRPIVTQGVLKAYPKIVELVSEVKRELKVNN
ncbi:hypothetical protein U472_08860 [Orenia metallireducens]|uniref:DUF3189 domain-containing protein n=1 Tax=Orenia metallireducens TaxID=1413210 RepID=A0A1C0A798_9FIRM|nr:DUF3189 family protein [Orenia metallireducens]OCL26116.1 hypothetical protein U472_08860 [Orenia metallireducens]